MLSIFEIWKSTITRPYHSTGLKYTQLYLSPKLAPNICVIFADLKIQKRILGQEMESNVKITTKDLPENQRLKLTGGISPVTVGNFEKIALSSIEKKSMRPGRVQYKVCFTHNPRPQQCSSNIFISLWIIFQILFWGGYFWPLLKLDIDSLFEVLWY